MKFFFVQSEINKLNLDVASELDPSNTRFSAKDDNWMKSLSVQPELNNPENESKPAVTDPSEEIGTPFTPYASENLNNIMLARKSIYILEEILDLKDPRDLEFYTKKVNNYVRECAADGYGVCLVQRPSA